MYIHSILIGLDRSGMGAKLFSDNWFIVCLHYNSFAFSYNHCEYFLYHLLDLSVSSSLLIHLAQNEESYLPVRIIFKCGKLL